MAVIQTAGPMRWLPYLVESIPELKELNKRAYIQAVNIAACNTSVTVIDVKYIPKELPKNEKSN